MKSNLLAIIIAVSAHLLSTQGSAAVITIPPGLAPGDNYRLVFYTGTKTNARSSDINYYNNFVSNVAHTSPSLKGMQTTWSAIITTSTTQALDNTHTRYWTFEVRRSDYSAPIYNLGGELVATSNNDLWDSSIQSPIRFNERGGLTGPDFKIWTGTVGNGMGWSGIVGDVEVTYGFNNRTDGGFIAASVARNDASYGLYAMSGILTVPVPEPGAIAFTSIVAIGLVSMMRYRRTKTSSSGITNDNYFADKKVPSAL